MFIRYHPLDWHFRKYCQCNHQCNEFNGPCAHVNATFTFVWPSIFLTMTSITQISECLAGTLNPNPNVRMTAELKLVEYFAAPGTPQLPLVAITRISCFGAHRDKFGAVGAQHNSKCGHVPATDESFSRSRPSFGRVLMALFEHSASIALRKYIKERWSPYFPSFKGSPPSVEVRLPY